MGGGGRGGLVAAGGRAGDVEWIPSHGNLPSLGLHKKEYGHLSKKKGIYRRWKYHHQPALTLLPSGHVLAVWCAGPFCPLALRVRCRQSALTRCDSVSHRVS